MQQEHQETNYIMLAIVLALGVFLVAGLVVVPTIELQQAQADKGGVPNSHSAGHGHGGHGHG